MERLSSELWQRVNDVALWLHAQTDIAAIQHGSLETLMHLIPHDASFFDLCCVRDERLLFFNPMSTTIDDRSLSDYYQRYELADYTRWCFTADTPVVYRDSNMISDAAREQSLIFREWMRPLEIYYSIGCTIVNKGTIYGSITLFRSRDHGDFADEELAILGELNKHLAVHFALLKPHGIFPGSGNEDMRAFAHENGLTEREADVMRLAAEGCTNREIGQELFIAESTVKKHVNAIYRKLKVENRVQLMRSVYSAATDR